MQLVHARRVDFPRCAQSLVLQLRLSGPATGGEKRVSRERGGVARSIGHEAGLASRGLDARRDRRYERLATPVVHVLALAAASVERLILR